MQICWAIRLGKNVHPMSIGMPLGGVAVKCSPGRQMTSAAPGLLTGRMGPDRCLHNRVELVRVETNLRSPCKTDPHIYNHLCLTPRHV